MDWVKEILNILATLVAISGLLSIPKLFSELSFIRKIDYDEWEKFKQREKEFDENTQLFEKEALLRTVGFLKNFTWKEYEFLKNLNFSLKLIKQLNKLKGKERLNLISDKFVIRNNFFDFSDSFESISLISFLFIFHYFFSTLIKSQSYISTYINFGQIGFFIFSIFSSFMIVVMLMYIFGTSRKIIIGFYSYKFIQEVIDKDDNLKNYFEFNS